MSKLPNWAVLGLCRILFGINLNPIVEKFVFKGQLYRPESQEDLSLGRLHYSVKGVNFYHTLGSEVVDEYCDDGMPGGQVVNHDFDKLIKLPWFAQEYEKYPGYTHCMWIRDWPSFDTIAKATAEIANSESSK